ncbi:MULTISPECIES: serpin family protein [Prauserella salsuginis group]|uniref:Serpin B n=2 Tax=Prauserella salsuginis group TaxID=2893672 RepID=A0A839XQ98_9PSEU|nr:MULTISPECIES: serpin family protein [Prauserella salsuginis group]MBB3665400.1 serpin B [Prauserella sediminis]MCR3718682.1 serpin B [Prauserella flava]MCR3733252.1 serpin B [Prauserella salsuginis]
MEVTTDPAEAAHRTFALAVHRATAGDPGTDDACVSPYSAAGALGLVADGARGETADEITALVAGQTSALADQTRLLDAAAVLEARTGQEEPVLAVSNTLWAWDGLAVEDGYAEALEQRASGRVAAAPFVDDPEAARAAINADVAATTRDLIPELLPPGSVGPDTVATLVNALYLRCAWRHPFPTDATADADFHGPDGPLTVPMMRQTARMRYAEFGGWQAVAVPAVGGVEAVVLLPDRRLADAEVALDETALADLLAALAPEQVRLTMPRVSLDVPVPLGDALRGLGVRRMFTPQADLGGLSGDPRLHVSDVLHRAVLRLDEHGLEGAAATAATMRLVSMPTGEPVVVDVNRPFLLLVRHAGTGAVYFVARVVTP